MLYFKLSIFYFLLSAFTLLFSSPGCAQPPLNKPTTINPDFDKKLVRLLDFSVPLMSVQELKKKQQAVVLFDTREANEYQVSHIEGARYLGYQEFDATQLLNIQLDTTIVLYCSVGYRSEKIGKKLQKMGYENVFNLYGSIFEWVNSGYTIVNESGIPTRQLHTYNKNWSQWVDENQAEKIW